MWEKRIGFTIANNDGKVKYIKKHSGYSLKFSYDFILYVLRIRTGSIIYPMKFIAILSLCFLSLAGIGARAQIRAVDSLLKVIKTERDDTSKAKNLFMIAFYMRTYNPDTTILLAQQALVLVKKLKWRQGEAGAYNSASLGYTIKGEFPNALDNGEKALRINEELGNKLGQASNLLNIGSIYYFQGDYPKTLDCCIRALKINEEYGNKLRQAGNLGNIGIVYSDMGDYAKALEYFQEALKIDEEYGSKEGQAENLSNIGTIYYNKGDYPKALVFFMRTLKIFEGIRNKLDQLNALTSIGNVYLKQGDYTKALDYYLKAIRIGKYLGNKQGSAEILGSIGILYYKTGKFKEAERKLRYAIAIDSAIGARNDLMQFEEELSHLYDTTGRYKLALHWFRKASILKDTLFSIEKNKAITRKELTYQYEKKEAGQKAEQEKKDAVRNAEEARQNAHNKMQKVIIWLIASTAIILVLLVILVFQRMKGAEKKKIIAEQQKSWLELKALRTQMNPHFIFNIINSIQSFVLKNDTRLSSEYLAQFSHLIRGVLENSRKEKITLAEEIDGLKNYIEFEDMRFPQRFVFDIRVDKTIDSTQTFLPPLLIQPYVENAIWHGLMHRREGEGKLIIIFEKSDGLIKCIVDDNGIGRKAANEMKNKTGHRSLGLTIVNERIDLMNKMYHWGMKVEVIDKVDNDRQASGTRVELMIPLLLNSLSHA